MDLAGKWQQFWSTVTGAFPDLTKILIFFGIALIVAAIAQYLWARRKGNGDGGKKKVLIWGCIVGAVVLAPDVLLPLALHIVDLVIAAAIFVYHTLLG